MNYLPEEKHNSITKKQFLWSCIFPLSLLIMANLLVFVLFSINNPNRGYEVIKTKWSLVNSSLSADWLILGDSSGNQGFNNDTFDRDLNTSSLNLCTIGDMLLLDDLWLLENYLKNKATPKNILLIHSYDVLAREELPQASFDQIPVELKNSSVSPPYNFGYFKKFLPLAYQKASLVYALKNPFFFVKKKIEYAPKGQQIIVSTDPNKVLKDWNTHLNNLNKKTRLISNTNRKALEAIWSLTSKHNIKAYFAHAPILEEMLLEKEFITRTQDLNEQIKAIGFTLIADQPFGSNKNELEGSIDHITYEASTRYTEHLVKKLDEL